jgi:hypothetical protein
MAKPARRNGKRSQGRDEAAVTEDSDLALVENAEGPDDEAIPEGTLVCALTDEQRVSTPQEETLESLIEQLHGEYGVEVTDMGHDRGECTMADHLPPLVAPREVGVRVAELPESVEGRLPRTVQHRRGVVHACPHPSRRPLRSSMQ